MKKLIPLNFPEGNKYRRKLVFVALFSSFADVLILGGIQGFISFLKSNFDVSGIVGSLRSNLSSWNINIFSSLEITNLTPISLIVIWSVLMLVLVFLRYLLHNRRLIISEEIFFNFELHWKERILDTLEKGAKSTIRIHGSSTLSNHLNEDMRSLKRGTESLVMGVQAVFQLLIFVPLLFWVSWQMSIIIFFALLPLVALLQKKMHHLAQPLEENFDKRMSFLKKFNSWNNLLLRWTLGVDISAEKDSLSQLNQEIKNKSEIVARSKSSLVAMSEAIASMSVVVVFSMAAWLIYSSSLSTSDIIIYCVILFLSYKPVKEFTRLIPVWKESNLAWKRLFALASLPVAKDIRKESFTNNVSIKELNFKYEDNQPKVFENYNLEFSLKQPVIIRGENGVGKSTLLKLLANIEQAQSGDILVPNAMLEKVSYLDQSPVLPSYTQVMQFLENLDLGSQIFLGDNIEVISPAQNLLEVLEINKIKAKVKDLESRPQIDEVNLNQLLSGGQVQRLGMALTLFSDSKTVLLDEPLSALPHENREEVLNAILEMTQLEKMDIIIVLHDQLPDLWESQCQEIKI